MARDSEKVRLDQLIVARGLAPSRERARALLMAGQVLLEGQPAGKPGTFVRPGAEISLRAPDHPFVGRGGLKLEGALDAFGIDVAGMTVLDVGASTGGFTDCVLRRDAVKVYALDVGHGQLDWRLRQDPRVVVIERVNIRSLDPALIADPIQLAVVDISFISIVRALEKLVELAGTFSILALVKPNFELSPAEVGRRGVVREAALRVKAVEKVKGAAVALGLAVRGEAESAVPGAKGNLENFLWLEKAGGKHSEAQEPRVPSDA